MPPSWRTNIKFGGQFFAPTEFGRLIRSANPEYSLVFKISIIYCKILSINITCLLIYCYLFINLRKIIFKHHSWCTVAMLNASIESPHLEIIQSTPEVTILKRHRCRRPHHCHNLLSPPEAHPGYNKYSPIGARDCQVELFQKFSRRAPRHKTRSYPSCLYKSIILYRWGQFDGSCHWSAVWPRTGANIESR